MLKVAKAATKSIAELFGVHVERAAHLLKNRRIRIIKQCAIDVVIDVGANKGQYGRELRRAGYSGRIVSFEPLTPAFDRLRRVTDPDPRWECRQLALGEVDETREINVSGNLVSSSLLPLNEVNSSLGPEVAYVGKETITVKRLDSLHHEFLRPGDRLYLKMDTQGYEKEVLSGASETLGQVHVIESELSLIPLYHGQALIGEMTQFMDSLGFDLISLDRAFWDEKTDRILQLDGLFVRRGVLAEVGAEREAVLS